MFQIVTMVNPDGFLEEDTQFSSPRAHGRDTSFYRDDSQDESDLEGGGQRDTENESVGD